MMTKSEYMDNNLKFLKFIQMTHIPLSRDRMIAAIEEESCPFSCKCCFNYILETCPKAKNCVTLRDFQSYAHSALFYRKGLSKDIKKALIDLIKRELL